MQKININHFHIMIYSPPAPSECVKVIQHLIINVSSKSAWRRLKRACHYTFGLHANRACASKNLCAQQKCSRALKYLCKPCKAYVYFCKNKYMSKLKNHLPSWAHNHKVYVPWDKIYMPWACGYTLMWSPAKAIGNFVCRVYTLF